jgi:hypothetical protein
MGLPGDVHLDSLSRLPLVKREEMDGEGMRFYDAVTGPHSRTLVGLQGPSGIWHRKPISGLGTKETLIISLGRQLFRERKVDTKTFAHALEVFGSRSLVNLAALMGNYAGTAIMLNLVDQQLRPDQKPLL